MKEALSLAKYPQMAGAGWALGPTCIIAAMETSKQEVGFYQEEENQFVVAVAKGIINTAGALKIGAVRDLQPSNHLDTSIH